MHAWRTNADLQDSGCVGLLRPEPRASCIQLLQHRDASYRAARERSRGGAARASWGGLNSSERQTVRGSGGSRERRGGSGGSGFRDRQSSRGSGVGREWQRGGRDEGGRGGSGRERGGERWGSDRAPDRRRGPGFGAQPAPQWDDRDERGWEEEEGGDWDAAGSGSASGGWRGSGRSGGSRQQQDRGGRRGGWGQQREGEDEEGGWVAPRPPSLKERWVGDYVYGVSPVLAALRAGRREVTALYMQEGMQLGKRKDKAAVQVRLHPQHAAFTSGWLLLELYAQGLRPQTTLPTPAVAAAACKGSGFRVGCIEKRCARPQTAGFSSGCRL